MASAAVSSRLGADRILVVSVVKRLTLFWESQAVILSSGYLACHSSTAPADLFQRTLPALDVRAVPQLLYC